MNIRLWPCILAITVILLSLVGACNANPPLLKTKSNGGIVILQVKPGCPVSEVISVDLSAIENTNVHKTQWTKLATITGHNQNEYIYNWNTTSCHNSTYTVKAEIRLRKSLLTVNTQIKITNLSIFNCYPDNVVINKDSETPCSITISMVDNDLHDPMDITIDVFALENHKKSIRTLRAKGLSGDKHTLIWDLKDNQGKLTEPAPYTFEVSVNQKNRMLYQGKLYTVTDSCTYRSKFLKVTPFTDKNGTPLSEWYDFTYFDNGTEKDESDDYNTNTIYFILTDTFGQNTKTGRLLVTEPEFTKTIEFPLSELECKLHKRKDCLDANTLGISHQPVFTLPASFWEYAGTYYSFLEVFDGHAAKYRDHAMRRALNY